MNLTIENHRKLIKEFKTYMYIYLDASEISSSSLRSDSTFIRSFAVARRYDIRRTMWHSSWSEDTKMNSYNVKRWLK